MIINHNKFSNYCFRKFLYTIMDFLPNKNESTISDIVNSVDAEPSSFKSVVMASYFDEYKVLKLSEFYKPAYGYNIRNNAWMEKYNTISVLGG